MPRVATCQAGTVIRCIHAASQGRSALPADEKCKIRLCWRPASSLIAAGLLGSGVLVRLPDSQRGLLRGVRDTRCKVTIC